MTWKPILTTSNWNNQELTFKTLDITKILSKFDLNDHNFTFLQLK